MKKVFITSSGSEIGKTFVTAALCRQLLDKSYKVKAIKPVITGWSDNAKNDTTILLDAQGLAVNQKNIHSCSPWRFRAPMSPDMAARRESREVNFDEVVSFCLGSEEKDNILLIEGAGGVMSPVSENKTNFDLITRLRAPVIMVLGTYLGSISHGLTALAAFKDTGNITVILNESEDAPVKLEEVERSFKKFCNAKIIPIHRTNNLKTLPDLTGLVL